MIKLYWYCWWRKSCTTWIKTLSIIGYSPYQLVNAGFLNHQQYYWRKKHCQRWTFGWWWSQPRLPCRLVLTPCRQTRPSRVLRWRKQWLTCENAESCYGGLGQWYLLKIQMQVKLSTQYFIAQTFPQNHKKVRLPCMRGYVQHCLTTICLHFCSWKSRFAENALVSHSPHCPKTTGCVKRCFQYQQGVLRDNLSQLSIDDIDIPGSSKGCWMDDKGSQIPLGFKQHPLEHIVLS